jgi:DNA-binding NarL/FixJ family response regulator
MAKTNRIRQTHRVTVETDGKNIVFIAEPDEGRLIIREEDENGKEVCSLKLANPDELSAFFEGLQRIFVSTQNQPRIQQTEQPRPMQRSLPDTSSEDDREEVISRARARNPNAFKGWSKSEEAEMIQRFQKGESIPSIARTLQRSEKAIQMRLRKNGLLPEDVELIPKSK